MQLDIIVKNKLRSLINIMYFMFIPLDYDKR